MHEFLKQTNHLDYEDDSFQAFIAPFKRISSQTERAASFYNFVRDYFLYDPYHLDLRADALRASEIIRKKRAWCVEKAIVFAAGLRALDIPSRLGYAIVENHIGVEKLMSILKTSKIVFHGYVEVYLSEYGTWTKATPAFDARVCRICRVEPLDWNGQQDSLFQEFQAGQQFMVYHHDYGVFEDVPVIKMNTEMQIHYPHLFNGSVENNKSFSFYFEPDFRLEP
jgi:hypothetical protein